ncbi:unnamed protein product [Closterium sp. NIES-54]
MYAMYAASASVEEDYYLCVPRDARVEATSLGAFSSASTGAEPEEALHTFTLDSGASRCFFRDSTTVTPLTVSVPITLADPSGGPIVACGATVLPCPAAPSGLLTGLHLPSFAKNLVATSVLQDQWVTVTQPGGELVAICTDSRTGEHLATFTRRPGSGLYTLTTESALVDESGQVAASVEVASSCSCRLLTHQTLLWHHCLGHPSLPRLHGMHSRLLVSSLPRSLPLLPRSLALPCLPCVEGRQCAAPHSSSFPPTTAPLQTLHMDVWGPARVTGQGGERYFLLVVHDYTRYTTVFPLQSKADVRGVLIRWICPVCLQLCARFREDLPVLRLHSDRGGEFCSHLLENSCGAEGIVQTYTLPASPQHNGIAERRIGLVMEPRVSHPETSRTLWWAGEVGDASAFRFRGSLSLRASSPHALFDVCYLSFLLTHCPDSFTTRALVVCCLPATSPLTSPSASTVFTPPQFLPRPPSPPLQPVTVDYGAARGGTTGGASFGGAGSWGAECPLGTGGTGGTGAGGPATSRQEALSPERLREWAVQWGSPGGGASRLREGGAGAAGARVTGTAEARGSTAGGFGVARAGSTSAHRQETLSPERLREWAVQWGSPGGGASSARSPRDGGTGGAAAVGTAAGSPGGGAWRAGAAGSGGASACVPGTGGTRATGGVGGAGGATGGTSGGVGGATGSSARVTGVSGARRQDSLSPLQLREWAIRWGSPGGGARGTGSGGAVATGAGGSGGATTQTQPSALSRLLSLPPAATEFPVPGTTPPLLFPPLLPGSLLPAPAPHTEVTASLTARHEPETRASTPECRELETRASVPACARRVRRPRAPAVPGTQDMTLRPSSVPQHVILPSPPVSSPPHVPDPESDLVRAASPTVTCLLTTVVIDPSFESAAVSALVAELVDFAALCRLDYAANSVSAAIPVSRRTYVPHLASTASSSKQFELECLTAAAPHLPTRRTYVEAITGPYSSQWQIAMDAEMASWKSTGTYVDKVPPSGANIVDGMWIFRLKRLPDSPPAFKARYVA